MQLRLIHQDLDLKNDNKYLSYEDDKLTRLENYFEDLYENSPVRILDKEFQVEEAATKRTKYIRFFHFEFEKYSFIQQALIITFGLVSAAG